jgi:hypothetical protein
LAALFLVGRFLVGRFFAILFFVDLFFFAAILFGGVFLLLRAAVALAFLAIVATPYRSGGLTCRPRTKTT